MANIPVPPSARVPREPLTDHQIRRLSAETTRIFDSTHFKGSKRSIKFLSFICEKTAHGEADLLKERTLGIELFDRNPMFDTSGDASVRVAAGEVRKRLAQFYQENESQGLRISLPAGSYVPELRWTDDAVAAVPSASVASASEPKPPGGVPSRAATRLILPLVAVGTLMLGAGYWLASARSQPGALPAEMQEFWKPFLSASQPILISVGVVTTHHAYPPIEELLSKGQSVAANSIPLIQYPMVPLGDSMALARIAELLSRQRKPFRVRESSNTEFADLKDAAILIGANSNPWTRIAQSELRFSIGRMPPEGRVTVIDSQAPTNRRWAATRIWPELSTQFDFALVSRLRDRHTGSWVVTVAGLTPFGTRSAGEFLTDPVRLSQALRTLPAGWQNKSLQLVLQTQIEGTSSGPSTVAAFDVR